MFRSLARKKNVFLRSLCEMKRNREKRKERVALYSFIFYNRRIQVETLVNQTVYMVFLLLH